MENTGLNLKEIKTRNLTSILYLLNANGFMSRKELSERLGLTPAAVTKLCGELIEQGLIKELGESTESTKAGRKKINLALRLEDYYALCINAEVDKITLSVACFSGELVCKSELGLSDNIEEIIKSAKRLIDSCSIEQYKIVCASICVIGRVDDSRFGLWNNKKLKKTAEKELGLPVIMDNNIRAFALAEVIYGRDINESNVLFLKWGPGIASAIARDGKILSGENSDVTEIGHYIINVNGKRCRCGRYGCLETEVSTMNIIDELDGEYALDEIISSQDLAVRSVVDTKIDSVALALTNTATILNSDKVILFGSMFNNSYVSDKLAKQCKRYNNNFDKDTIALSKLNGKISYIGPVALAAKKFFFDAKAQDKN